MKENIKVYLALLLQLHLKFDISNLRPLYHIHSNRKSKDLLLFILVFNDERDFDGMDIQFDIHIPISYGHKSKTIVRSSRAHSSSNYVEAEFPQDFCLLDGNVFLCFYIPNSDILAPNKAFFSNSTIPSTKSCLITNHKFWSS